MTDPHRRCGSTGHAASISTFEGSNSSSSCGSRLGNREVEHGENDGVDEWHVAGDHGGSTTEGAGGGAPPAGRGRRASGAAFCFVWGVRSHDGGPANSVGSR